jgi:hypothetical protein
LEICEQCEAHLYVVCHRCDARNQRVIAQCIQCSRPLHDPVVAKIRRRSRSWIRATLLIVILFGIGLAIVLMQGR